MHVAVIGPADVVAGEEFDAAEEIGRLLAEAGAVVVCGGRGGVMEAVCRGARSVGGVTVGILPGRDRREANAYVEVVVPTGLGEARNALVARAGDVVVAVGGGYGTLSEIAFALKGGTPVVGLGTWELVRGGVPDTGIVQVSSAAEAARTALELARK
ncbi:MAG TPA: TIGR00725 family protein [Thermoleophilaceae bacterium]